MVPGSIRRYRIGTAVLVRWYLLKMVKDGNKAIPCGTKDNHFLPSVIASDYWRAISLDTCPGSSTVYHYKSPGIAADSPTRSQDGHVSQYISRSIVGGI